MYPWGSRLANNHPIRRRWNEARACGWDLRARTLELLRERPLNKDQMFWRLREDRYPAWSLQEHWDQLDPMLNDLVLDGHVERLSQDDAVTAGGLVEKPTDSWWSWWRLTTAARDSEVA
ncbi:hypothetical protein [Lentzea cavernae]|uniref:Winged helix-turn-helix domain-containing protein n=1 Tax=Lentzea cavernae TaxID=2020703 RepID=A0ABQ3N114_9PSEU|nr:hypothetical protein [Lentzea cavernae]GHH57813.1 hypothetical protein GCM10017774_78140 [Lentzea cavernae]